MKLWLTLLLISFQFAPELQARTTVQRLITVTSDGLEGTLDLSARINSRDEATHLILTKREDPNYFREYEARQLARGIVILEKSGHDVVIVRSGEFDTTRGGFVVLDYLSNGLRKSRQQLELEIQHDGRRWVVIHEGVEVDTMFMEARKLLGNVIGIRNVRINP